MRLVNLVAPFLLCAFTAIPIVASPLPMVAFVRKSNQVESFERTFDKVLSAVTDYNRTIASYPAPVGDLVSGRPNDLFNPIHCYSLPVLIIFDLTDNDNRLRTIGQSA